MCIVNFTRHNILRVHPYCYKWQNFLLFSGQIVFQCVCVCVCHVFFINLFINDHLGYFPTFVIVNDAAINMGVEIVL